MIKEIWRMIPGYEGLYMVSDRGRVKSLDKYVKSRYGNLRLVKGRILKPFNVGGGYLQVKLYKDGKMKRFLVHRLVAEAFMSNPDNLPEVNHKDENPSNNCVENLEWCTAKYNTNYGTAIERRSKKRINDVRWSKPVLQYTRDGNFVREWPSARECGRNGFNQGNVAACCRGECKQAYGFKWKYK